MEKRHSYFKNEIKIRAENEEESGMYIEGYFTVFNQKTELWNGWYEQIAVGAMDNSVKNNDIRCLFNHESGNVLGRMSSGTLEVKTDDYGLWGKVKINENDKMAMDVYARVQRGDISGCSFGFYSTSESYVEKGDDIIWTVEEADTIEISVCAFPAYKQTEIEARKKNSESKNKRRIEKRKEEVKKRIGELKC